VARSISQEFTFRVLPVNQAPVWNSSPSPTFVQGTAAFFPASGTYQSNGYVTDPDGNPITITWLAGSVSGVTWDGGRFVYDGLGSLGTTGGLVLRASDGTAGTNSSAFSIQIASGLAWSATPSVSFVEASVTPVNLGSDVTNYNASTDEFRVTPSYSLPSWLTLTTGPGAGSGNLTPNGTQVDANDIPPSPGIKIDVRRSGGAWVSSAAFGVTVYVVVSGDATWNDWSEFSYAYGSDQAEVGDPQTSTHALGNWLGHLPGYITGGEPDWQTNIARRNDINQLYRLITPIYGAFFEVVADPELPLICVVPG